MFPNKRSNSFNYLTRCAQNYCLPKCRLHLNKSLFLPVVLEWNALSLNISVFFTPFTQEQISFNKTILLLVAQHHLFFTYGDILILLIQDSDTTMHLIMNYLVLKLLLVHCVHVVNLKNLENTYFYLFYMCKVCRR